MSWDAALEVEPSALCVHANIYTPNKKVYERGGDDKLRSNFHQRVRELLKVRRVSFLRSATEWASRLLLLLLL